MNLLDAIYFFRLLRKDDGFNELARIIFAAKGRVPSNFKGKVSFFGKQLDYKSGVWQIGHERVAFKSGLSVHTHRNMQKEISDILSYTGWKVYAASQEGWEEISVNPTWQDSGYLVHEETTIPDWIKV